MFKLKKNNNRIKKKYIELNFLKIFLLILITSDKHIKKYPQYIQL